MHSPIKIILCPPSQPGRFLLFRLPLNLLSGLPLNPRRSTSSYWRIFYRFHPSYQSHSSIMLITSSLLTIIFTILKMYLHNLDSKYNQNYRSMKLAISKSYNNGSIRLYKRNQQETILQYFNFLPKVCYKP